MIDWNVSVSYIKCSAAVRFTRKCALCYSIHLVCIRLIDLNSKSSLWFNEKKCCLAFGKSVSWLMNNPNNFDFRILVKFSSETVYCELLCNLAFRCTEIVMRIRLTLSFLFTNPEKKKTHTHTRTKKTCMTLLCDRSMEAEIHFWEIWRNEMNK